jgi:DNA/RNA-binding domain of Phe-tRNA-synthetase-like protein
MRFALGPELAGIVRPGILWMKGAVVKHEAALDGPLRVAADAMRDLLPREGDGRSRPSLVRPEDESQSRSGEARGFRLRAEDLRHHIDLVRSMYKRVGIDPTRRRPSSEALLRRVLKGEPLPRVNCVVDVCNWCSLESQLPYGLYDASRIAGDVTLRVGRPGESYPGIRKDDVNVAGRIALVDGEGPFGNPTSDSARTMITPATMEILLVIFAPREIAETTLARILEVTAARMHDFSGAYSETQQLY